MQNLNYSSPPPESPRSVLPPLSKYYYGPAQGRASPQRGAPDDGRVSTSPAIAAPPLPPRHPPNTDNFSASQWMNHFASTEQLWQIPGPPTSTPPTNQVASTAYNPSTYGPMPGQSSAAGPIGRQPGASAWGGIQDNNGTSKPPLPPRPYASAAEPLAQQGSSDSHAHDEYLPSLSYNPIVEQSTFLHHPGPLDSSSNDGVSPPPPHRLPPAPPPKLPPDDESEGSQTSGEAGHNTLSSPQQAHHYPVFSNQDQPGNLGRHNSSKDHVTYSIPSSIWRQDQVSQSTKPHPDQPHVSDEPQRSDSFYWQQSPRSSIHSMKDEDMNHEVRAISDHAPSRQQSAVAFSYERKDSDAIALSSSLTHSTLGPYGASALGFGGPSDWEHFGDYEAEEIDDTELYIRPKPSGHQIKESASAELPASFLPEEDDLSRTQPASSRAIDDPPTSAQGPDGTLLSEAQVSGPVEAESESKKVADAAKHEQYQGELADGLRKAADEEAQPAEVNVVSPASDASDGDTLASNLDKTIQAWSRASSAENLESGKSTAPDIERPKNALHEQEPVAASTQLDPVTQIMSTRNDASPATLSNDFESSPTLSLELKLDTTPTRSDASPGPQPATKCDSTPAITEADHAFEDVSAPAGHANLDHNKETSQIPPTFVASTDSSTKAKETDDPYAGLDAWGKASLNRYIAMLREESEAETDKDKLKIFTVFTSRETRLRAVLYGAENEPPADQATFARTRSIKRASTTAFKRASKALPALPGQDSLPVSPETNNHARKSPAKLSAAAILGSSKTKPEPLQALDTTVPTTLEILADIVDSANEVQFSPGGRPIVPPTNNLDRRSYTFGVESLAVAIPDQIAKTENRSDLSIPRTKEHPQAHEGQATAGDASSYKPFKYTEGRSEAHNYAANRQSKRQSQFRPYAAKTMGSDEYREVFLADKPTVESVNGVEPTYEIRPASSKPEEPLDPSLRRFIDADFDPLLSVLPKLGEVYPGSLQLVDLRQVTDAVPDDFGFIHQSVVAWDGKARKQREINERERHARQIQSEQKIDALFDDHEIGYGDISELESGFKRSEAVRKTDEDRSEYKTFVAEVFNVVWARLHYEIDQLSPHYTKYTDALNDSTAGKDMFDPSGSRLALAPTMDALLTLHQKLEIRHQKAFEAVLERDRRLKKTELSPLYSLGNIAKVKQLEKQFEDAEKRAIVEYCRQRDIRANSLMDVLDQNTLRGVGANQDYMEMVMKAVRRIASGRAFASQAGGGERGVGLEEVSKAKSVTKALATSSEQIVQTFHVADMLLNAADYELSVAKAKLSDADAVTFQTLKEERSKEDQKLMKDLEHRLALIREDSRRTNDEIVKLLLFLGVQNGHAEHSSTMPQLTDAGHEERLHKALDEAKRRNALKEPDFTTVI